MAQAQTSIPFDLDPTPGPAATGDPGLQAPSADILALLAALPARAPASRASAASGAPHTGAELSFSDFLPGPKAAGRAPPVVAGTTAGRPAPASEPKPTGRAARSLQSGPEPARAAVAAWAPQVAPHRQSPAPAAEPTPTDPAAKSVQPGPKPDRPAVAAQASQAPAPEIGWALPQPPDLLFSGQPVAPLQPPESGASQPAAIAALQPQPDRDAVPSPPRNQVSVPSGEAAEGAVPRLASPPPSPLPQAPAAAARAQETPLPPSPHPIPRAAAAASAFAAPQPTAGAVGPPSGGGEKFAALAGQVQAESDNAQRYSEKKSLPVVNQLDGHITPRVGIASAQLASAMPAQTADRSSPAGPSDLFRTPPAQEGAPGRTTGGQPEASPNARAAQAVNTVVALVDAQVGRAQGTASAVRLNFNFNGDDLAVRVVVSNGVVHTQFRTDSPELREAIATQWQSAPTAAGGALNFLKPSFSSSSSQGDPAPGPDGGASRRQESPETGEQGRGSTFARPGPGAAPGKPSRTADNEPAAPAGRLHAFA